MPLGFRSSFSSSCVVSLAFLTAVALGQPRDVPPKTNPTRPIDRTAASAPGEEIVIDGIGVGTLYSIPVDAEVERHFAGVSAGQKALSTEAGAVACMSDPTSVYCNTLGNSFWRPPGPDPTTLVADDLALIATAGCELDRYVIKVTGNSDGLGTGAFTVDAALYDSCPGAFFGSATPIPGTQCQGNFSDEGIKLLTCNTPLLPEIPRNLYLSVKFNRAHCGVAVGAPALKGFSADRLDFKATPCRSHLGGFVPSHEFGGYGRHASFYAELYTRNECFESYPAYKSTNHNGAYYTPGGFRRFADDISLSVTQCNLVAYEVAVKGQGAITFDLRRDLNNADPADGGVIPGTRATAIGGGDDPVIKRVEIDPPIYIKTSDLWVGFVTTGSTGGPILTGIPAQLGASEDYISVYTSTPEGDRWVIVPGAEWIHMAFDIALYCEDSPPTGACCDMVLAENKVCIAGENYGNACGTNWDCPGGTCVGDSVCRDDLPLMNCATAAVIRPDGVIPLWRENDTCGGICLGGVNHDQPCNNVLDCPGNRCNSGPNVNLPCESDADCGGMRCARSTCEDSFPRSCGLASCCTLDDQCIDLPARECYMMPPVEEPRKRMYQLGKYCGLGGQDCPLGACLERKYACLTPHDEPGCFDPFCCTAVCGNGTSGAYCCVVEWDKLCVDLAVQFCFCPALGWPYDGCLGPEQGGPRLVMMNESTTADLYRTALCVNNLPFCCHNDGPDGEVVATAWYKFIGPEPSHPENEYSSVRVSTCGSSAGDARDSILQVFASSNPDRGICRDGAACSVTSQDCSDGSYCEVDDLTACDSLIPIACNDDGSCGRPELSSVCVSNIVPGRTYYVMIGVKSEEFRDEYVLSVTANCNVDPRLPNDLCSDAEPLTGGYPEITTVLWDISGGDEFQEATLDCNMDTAMPGMLSDIWYDWTAPCSSSVRIDTCDLCLISDEQANTNMMIYRGCDCPVSAFDRIAMSDFCGRECGLSSCIEFYAVEGQCYKIRLGGHNGETPAGPLNIDVDYCEPCPPAEISFVDPADRTVDARQPHPPHNAEAMQGITSFRIDAPNEAGMTQCWTICETNSTGTDNFVTRIVDVDLEGFTVELDRPLTPGSVTTLVYTDQKGGTQTATFTSHPANVNGDDRANASDVGAFIDILNGPPDAEWNGYSTDCDHSGRTTPADLLCIINLLNGGDAHQPWNGSDLPQCHDCCPTP